MTGWKEAMTYVASNIEDQYDALKLRLRKKLGIGPVQLLTYLGHGTRTELYLRGRAVSAYNVAPPEDNDTVWQNLLNMYRRFNSHEIPHARVRARFGEQTQDLEANVEGFFEVRFKLDEPLPEGSIWHEIELELLDYLDQDGARGTGSVLIPPAGARFGIISDLDDTVLKTDVLDLLKMARNTFLNNARTRLPFAGVAQFYTALQRGTTGTFNPIYYISNSPWNLYDLLVDFFEIRGIPLGPLFLTDLGLTDDHFLRPEPFEHKLGHIDMLLATHPDLPFILIGDSSEADPEIYRQVVERHPGRIPAIYIRDVSQDIRDEEVRACIKAIRALGSEMLLIPDTIAAATHAIERGFIPESAMDAIADETTEDKRQPEGLEAFIDTISTDPEDVPPSA